MSGRRPAVRRGLSLVELMIALLLAGIVGIALTRLVVNQARFVATQDGMLQARSAARAALNALTNELRAVGAGGFVAGTADSITVRVPYAFGVACQQTGGATNVALLPGDSSIYRRATASGYAWRDTSGIWQFEEPATVANGTCSPAGPAIATLSATGWPARRVAVSPNDLGTIEGSLVYLYQTVRFAIAPSASLSGRLALWRVVLSTGVRDELVAPFDTGTAFRFLVGSRLTARAAPPAQLDSVLGVQVRLVGQSENAPEGKSAPARFEVSTNIVFRNSAP